MITNIYVIFEIFKAMIFFYYVDLEEGKNYSFYNYTAL